jgi:transposase
MRNHPPTLVNVKKRKQVGKSNREIIRCPNRYIVREIFTHLCRPETLLGISSGLL